MLELPLPFPNWRFFRLVLQTGKVKHVRDQIRTREQLEHYVRAFRPVHVFNSIAYFSDPTSVGFDDYAGKKSGFQQAHNLILGGDLVFDFDARNRTMELARCDALTCRDWLLEKGYAPLNVFSGRGFHLRVTKHDLDLRSGLPQQRLKEYREIRQPLVEELRERGVQFDSEVTLNPKGLIRLVGSVHGSVGFVVSPVQNLETFEISQVERVSVHGTSSPATQKGNDDQEKEKKNAEGSLTGQRLPDQPDTPTTFVFIDSRVVGTSNRQVVLIRFSNRVKPSKIRKRLLSLINSELMAPFFLFQSKDYSDYYALSPTAVEQEHFGRLLCDFPEGRLTYRRFGRRILPLSLHYVSRIGRNNSKAVISRAHSNLLRRALNLRIQGIECGNSILRIGIGELRS